MVNWAAYADFILVRYINIRESWVIDAERNCFVQSALGMSRSVKVWRSSITEDIENVKIKWKIFLVHLRAV